MHDAMIAALGLLCILVADGASLTAVDGLLVSFKPVPAHAVPTVPQFSWAVPPSATVPDAVQIAYQIIVTTAFDDGAPVWDSGRVSGNSSIGVAFAGAPLRGGRAFFYNVSVWLSDNAPPSTSDLSMFTTALEAGDWVPDSAFVWSSNLSSTFSLLRGVVSVSGSAPVALALLHASAQTGDDTILAGYTAWLDGVLVGLGPGRGEARIWGGDGLFRALPYDTYDVTALVQASAGNGGNLTMAAASVGGENTATRGVLLQLSIFYLDGEMKSVATDGNFSVCQADAWLRPTDAAKPSATAYHHKLEFTDARLEPVGWRTASFVPLNGTMTWLPATVTVRTDSTAAVAGLTAKMAASVVAMPASATDPPVTIALLNQSFGFADFGREFQGGLSLYVASGTAGARVTLIGGESQADGIVGSTWGYNFTWTLRDGPQTIEQLQYMEFRYVNVIITSGDGSDANVPLSSLELRAWRVMAAWTDSKSNFNSTNSSLNAIWTQSRYTIEAGLLDTYTDSNTRERRVYEADGLITATSRLLVQGDVAWVRHSHAYVFYKPTWPVEWQQMGGVLALQDYWATGSTDLAVAYLPLLRANTHYADVDATGLLNTSYGRHIIDWDPWPTEAEYHQSAHFSVTQFWALASVRALALCTHIAGLGPQSTALAAQANALNASIHALMMNETTGLFCDGICVDPRVEGFASTYSSAWALATGALDDAPQYIRAAAWQHVADHGLEGYGSYGAFMMLSSLNAYPDGDDGTATLEALTKCDDESWCAEMRQMNATMTRESWLDPTATYSHAWGTSPVVAIVGGFMGLRQTAPTWEFFTVAPRLGGVDGANITIPTMRGLISVTANATHTSVRVPCGARAKLCVPHGHSAGGNAALHAGRTLFLDGAAVLREFVIATAFHLCVSDVGCGAAGAFRVGAVQ